MWWNTMTDINRRKLLQSIGATTGAGLTGLGFSTSAVAAEDGPDITREQVSVSEASIENALGQEESKFALKEASFKSLNRDKAKGYEIKVVANGTSRKFHEVVAPSYNGEATFSYVKSKDANNVASVKTRTGTIIRATARDNEIQTEILEFGDDVINEALQTLERSGKKTEIENTGVSTLHTDQAAASFDRTSNITHLYIPAVVGSNEKAVVYAKIPESGNPDSVTVMQQSYWECVASCVALQSTSIGFFCWAYACGACAGGFLPSCAACLACAGGVVGACGTVCV